jgi:myo-inositol-1(or 4)-monophosphatase
MEPLVNVAVQIARQAGDFIRRSQDQVSFLEVKLDAFKGESTQVDIQAENIIIQGIRKKFPKHNILSEECGLIDNQSDITWIVDPLDGTKNFLHGITHYAVSIAIQIKNQIEHAVIYDPIRHECFSASRGRGAQLNNRRIRVGQNNNINQSLIGIGKSITSMHAPQEVIDFTRFNKLLPSTRQLGCASLDIAYVAAGRLDGYVAYGMNPWDCAAGILMILEAGGVVTDFQGQSQALPHQQMMVSNIKLNKNWLDTFKVSLGE